MAKLENSYFPFLLSIYFLCILSTAIVCFIILTSSVFSSFTGCLISDDYSIAYRPYKICIQTKENSFSFTMIRIIVIDQFVTSISILFFQCFFIGYAKRSNLMNFKKKNIPVISLIAMNFLFNILLIIPGLFILNYIKNESTINVLLCSTPLNDNSHDKLKWFQSTKDYSLDQLVNQYKLDKVSFLHFVNSANINDCNQNGQYIPVDTKIETSRNFVVLLFSLIGSSVATAMVMFVFTESSRKKFLMKCLIKHDVTIVESNKEMFNNFVLNNFNPDEIFLLRFMEEVLGDTDLINELWDTYKNSRIVVVIADPLPEINGLNSPAAEAA